MFIIRHLLFLVAFLVVSASPSHADVSIVKAVSDFSGLSTDTKPVDQQPGTKFYETDTNNVFIYKGSAWSSDVPHDFLLEVAKGNIAGHTAVNKFGSDPVVNSTESLIWPYAGAMSYSTSADITSISSSDVGDNQVVYVNGLNANWDEITITATLEGQDEVLLSTPLIRVHRAINRGSTDFAGNIYIYTDAATVVNGVPSPASTVRGYITNGDNQTLQAAYTIPAGKTGYIVFGKTSVASGKDAIIKFYGRGFGGVFSVQHVVDVNSENYDYFFKLPLAMPEKSDLEVRARQSGGGTLSVSAAFDIILVDNP